LPLYVENRKLRKCNILFRNQEFSAPVEAGETYEVSIDDIARKGDGIARIEGFVIFVPDAKVGENITVKVSKVMRKFAFAEKVE
jgi:predicted RNA-binding protein with TRAM domain